MQAIVLGGFGQRSALRGTTNIPLGRMENPNYFLSCLPSYAWMIQIWQKKKKDMPL